MKKVMIILILSSFVFVFVLIDNYFSKKSKTIIENESIKKFSDILESSIDDLIEERLFKDLLKTTYDETKEISAVYINTESINNLLSKTNQKISSLLNEETKCSIPLGSLIFKSFLSDKGPMVNIRVIPTSSYKTDVITKTNPLGINNTNFEVYLKVILNLETVVPLIKEQVSYETELLLASVFIQGETPEYYYYSGQGTIEALPQ